MAEMSKELMDLINEGGYCYLATASKDGMPNIAIIGSTSCKPGHCCYGSRLHEQEPKQP